MRREAMSVNREGFEAWEQGIPMIHCPYFKYSDEWYEWMDGWKQNWFANLNKARGSE